MQPAARVLEERSFERLGGTETLRMEARLMALTNTDLVVKCRGRAFFARTPVYYQRQRTAIVIPPLRERRTDIRELAIHFLARLGPVHGRADAAFEPSAAALLESYEWPGNVRELKNAVEHALVFTKQPQLSAADFLEIMQRGNQGPRRSGGHQLSFTLEDVEREVIKATLEATRYKIGYCAEILGISRKTLLEKRKKYGLL